LIVDGKLVAAVEEERFSRVKKHVRLGYPFKAIEYCLKAAGIRFQDLSDIAIESRVVHHRHLLSALESAFGSFTAKPHLVGHHMAHAASAVFASPFDEGSFIVVDAHGGVAGNGITTLAGGFKGNALEVLEEIWSPYSLGLAWAYVTDALGFNKQTDAGKVMALASYSTDPRFSHLVKRVDSSFISVLDSSVFRELKVDKSDFEESAALAYALQLATEECMKSMAGKLRAHYKSGNLCLAGGVSLNSVANGLLLLEGYADRIFIQPAADDSGLSLGAAYYVNHITYGNRKKGWLRNVFLGPEYDDKGVLAALEKSGLPYYVPEDRYAACSKLLAAGEILGWFQAGWNTGLAPSAIGASFAALGREDQGHTQREGQASGVLQAFRGGRPGRRGRRLLHHLRLPVHAPRRQAEAGRHAGHHPCRRHDQVADRHGRGLPGALQSPLRLQEGLRPAGPSEHLSERHGRTHRRETRPGHPLLPRDGDGRHVPWPPSAFEEPRRRPLFPSFKMRIQDVALVR
jgi:hypothetical protein